MEDSKDGYHCSHCRGCSDVGLSKEHEFNIPLLEEDDAQGENWFKGENLTAKRRLLLCLERKLEVAFLFEHGDGEEGGSWDNPI